MSFSRFSHSSFESFLDRVPDGFRYIRDFSYTVLYDIARGYGILFVFLLVFTFYIFKLNVAYTYLGVFMVLMTFFENALFVRTENTVDVNRMIAFSLNNIDFMHSIAVLISFILTGKCYLYVKRAVIK